MASRQHDSAHTKYHSGLVVSKSLGAGEEKAVFKAREKLESPLSCPYHHCTCAEQGAGTGSGPWLSGRQLPALPITLCLMPRTVPSSCKPHGKGHMGSLGWEPALLQEKGGAQADSKEHRWGTATTSAIDGEPKPCVARAQPPLPAPCTPGTEHRCCPGLEGGRCGSDGALARPPPCHTSPG